MWPILGFYTPLNISGTAEARIVKFCVAVVVRHIKFLVFGLTKRPWKGRGQGHAATFRILHPMKSSERLKLQSSNFVHGLAMRTTNFYMTNVPQMGVVKATWRLRFLANKC